MALEVPSGAESIIMQYVVNKASPQDLKLCLFTNNHTPVEGDDISAYTEASGNGYAEIALTGASWTISGSAPTQAAYAQQTFTFTGALGNVYGYYLKRTTGGELMWAEKFTDGPYNIANNGDTIKITPVITGD